MHLAFSSVLNRYVFIVHIFFFEIKMSNADANMFISTDVCMYKQRLYLTQKNILGNISTELSYALQCTKYNALNVQCFSLYYFNIFMKDM